MPFPTMPDPAADRAHEDARRHPERETLELATAGAAKVLEPDHGATKALARASITMATVDLWRAFFLVRRSCFKGVVCLNSRREAKVKFFTGFVATVYLLGALGFGGNHYSGHPEQGLFEAVVRGLAWPGILVEMARDPSF